MARHFKYVAVASKLSTTLPLILLVLLASSSFVQRAQCHDDDDVNIEAVADEQQGGEQAVDESAKTKPYISPKLNPEHINLLEVFDDAILFQKKWIHSADERYTGKWELNSGPDRPRADLQLVLPHKARHYAISTKLDKPFKFTDKKPLVVQYEVQYRDGNDCGGSYVKLLRQSASSDLSKVGDKTPYSIMFGPDKCGSDSKIHFIVQYLNPKTNQYEEKHWSSASQLQGLLPIFNDKKHHLFKLVVKPDNSFEVFLDDKLAGKGSLLEDLNPPINPPEKIVDVDDKKPEDWDERPQIEDPDAKKPEDWDDNAPKTIPDPNAVKPDDWLEHEPKYIADPEAKKPDDWEEMDGEWQAPLIENPNCAGVSGCGEWKAPDIPNPKFKGIWKPPKITNPKYKGNWAPRMIPNPDYFYDENPFASLETIGAAAFELWSMADNVAFDNFILASDLKPVEVLQIATWQEKKVEADAVSSDMLTRVKYYFSIYPWLWAVLVLSIAISLFLFVTYCCDYKGNRRRAADVEARKKRDESRQDDKKGVDEKSNDQEKDEDEDETVEDEEKVDLDDEDEVADEEEQDEEDDDEEEEEMKPAGKRQV